MDENKTIELVIKDEKILNFYNKRTKLCETLMEAYEAKKDYYRMLVLNSNMDRIHFESMINKVEVVKKLNETQINKQYNINREKEIVEKFKELNYSDWTEDEKKTKKYYSDQLEKLNTLFIKKMDKVKYLQYELHNQVGEQNIIKLILHPSN